MNARIKALAIRHAGLNIRYLEACDKNGGVYTPAAMEEFSLDELRELNFVRRKLGKTAYPEPYILKEWEED